MIDITKFQNFLMTLIAVIAYVAMACGALAAKPGDFPGFDAHLLWLIGISHATYVGGKIPKRA